MPELQNGQEPIEVTKTEPTPAQLVAQAKAAAAGASAEGTVTPAEPAAVEAAAPAQGAPAAAEAGKDASDGGEETPAWKQKQEESANREAAAARIKLREAQAKIAELEGLVTENASLKDQLTVAQVALERADVVAEFGLPKDLAKLVAGNTVEELKASAELLARHVAPGAGRVRREPAAGGLNPFNGGDELSGKSAYQRAKSQR